jgi:eukaryotic-like serine/threonine-protein kinase
VAVLTPGSRLGSYEVLAAIGAGGMGEVYRARDAKLGRDIALKVLPEIFALDPDRLARFKREAQVLASLNHPNIASIHGLEESGHVRALVLELVEGPTLADRIELGPIPIDEALTLARQIAEALEAAHDSGIIHRDLKPANIKVRPDGAVKILDFGLAKALDPIEPTAAAATVSPTITSPALTQMGVLLGTAAYMSPEQIKGRQVDKASDVWAFGAVLYEMLTGRRAFKGEDVSDTLASVLREDVDAAALPPATPAPVRRLIARCLERDAKRRLRDIREARLALADPSRLMAEDTKGAPAVAASGRRWHWAIPAAIAGIVAAAVTGVAVWSFTRQPQPPKPITRFTITLPDGQSFVGATPRHTLALSSDGSQMVYAASNGLFRRSLSDLQPQPIRGTEQYQTLSDPVFSPDDRSLLFYAGDDGYIKRILVGGGVAQNICRADAPYGVSWSREGIFFGQGDKGIMRVSPQGGAPTVVVTVKEGQEAHGPQLLPGGQHLLYTVAMGNDPDRWERAHIVVQPLAPGSSPKTVIEGGTDARYLPTGHLVFAVDGTVLAAPFDLQRLEVTGPREQMVHDVRWSGGRTTGAYHFSTSNSGTLIHLIGFRGERDPWDLVRTNRKGDVERINLPPRRYTSVRVSPDGAHLAVGVEDAKEAMIFTYELSGANDIQRLTYEGHNRYPVWSSDSKRVAFQSDRGGDLAIWQSAAGGTAERLTKPEPGEAQAPEAWHPKNDVLLYSVTKGSDVSLWTLSLRDRKAMPYGDVHSSYPTGARFHPDGEWVVYVSRTRNDIGIYVQPFPATGVKYQLNIRGANASPHKPVWSPDGKELFYVPRVLEFEAVAVTTQPTFAFGNAIKVPRPFQPGAPNLRSLYDIAPDGRFIGLIPQAQMNTAMRRAPIINVVVNWFEELKK